MRRKWDQEKAFILLRWKKWRSIDGLEIEKLKSRDRGDS